MAEMEKRQNGQNWLTMAKIGQNSLNCPTQPKLATNGQNWPKILTIVQFFCVGPVVKDY